MRKDFQFALVIAVAAIPAGIVVSEALEVFSFLKEHPGFGFCISSAVTVVLLFYAGVLAVRGERAAKQEGSRRRMIPLAGMIISLISFSCFSAWYWWPTAKKDTGSRNGVNGIVKSANDITLKDLFDTDLHGASFSVFTGGSIDLFEGKKKFGKFDFDIGIFADFSSNSQFMALYLEGNESYKTFLRWFSTGYKVYLYDMSTNLRVWTATPDSSPTNENMIFTKRLYVYTDNVMTDSDRFEIEALYRSVGLDPTFRGFRI